MYKTKMHFLNTFFEKGKNMKGNFFVADIMTKIVCGNEC